MRSRQQVAAIVALLVVFLAACGSDEITTELASSPEIPIVVATTNILGDVLGNLAGGQFEVVTIMPVGSDPHTFQPSAQDVAAIYAASAIIANGASFEGGLLDAVNAAEENGTPVFDAITAVAPIDFSPADEHDDDHDDDGDDDHAEGDHGDDGDDDHDDDGDGDHAADGDHGDDDGHGHGALDPHFFTDPARMAAAVEGIREFLIANVDTIDSAKLQVDATRYISLLTTLDEQVDAMLAAIPDSQRVLVTNHEVFGYFADRYNFEVIGTVVPVGSGADGVSGRRLVELAALLQSEGVSVVFADTSSSKELAQTLASEVGEVAVVQLYTESLGDHDSDGATYVEMVRSNARQISEALAK